MHIIDDFLVWWDKNKYNFDAVFFDIDGTLIAGGQALPGAADTLSIFRKDNIPFTLLTNDGNHSLQEKSHILKRCGIDVSSEEIVSCSSALKYLAQRNKYIGEKFFVMGELGRPDFAEDACLHVIRETKKISECRGVIIGEGSYDWQENINAVLNYYILNKTEGIMIVPNPDSYWPSSSKGEIGIGAGGKARFLQAILKEYGIKIKPVYLGKPYKPVYQYALKHLSKRFDFLKKITKKRILMIGDSLLSDVKGANKVGFSSALILTGISKEQHIALAKPAVYPDFIFRQLNGPCSKKK